MAAIIASILHFVNSGDHIITLRSIYGPVNNFIDKYLIEKSNISVTCVDGKRLSDFEEAINDKTALIHLENPLSMTFELQEITGISDRTR